MNLTTIENLDSGDIGTTHFNEITQPDSADVVNITCVNKLNSFRHVFQLLNVALHKYLQHLELETDFIRNTHQFDITTHKTRIREQEKAETKQFLQRCLSRLSDHTSQSLFEATEAEANLVLPAEQQTAVRDLTCKHLVSHGKRKGQFCGAPANRYLFRLSDKPGVAHDTPYIRCTVHEMLPDPLMDAYKQDMESILKVRCKIICEVDPNHQRCHEALRLIFRQQRKLSQQQCRQSEADLLQACEKLCEQHSPLAQELDLTQSMKKLLHHHKRKKLVEHEQYLQTLKQNNQQETEECNLVDQMSAKERQENVFQKRERDQQNFKRKSQDVNTHMQTCWRHLTATPDDAITDLTPDDLYKLTRHVKSRKIQFDSSAVDKNAQNTPQNTQQQ
jgi:hypothetical protein